MSNDEEMTQDGIPLFVNGKCLSQTAIAALREARDRQEQLSQQPLQREVKGAKRTTEPTRYGDWEKAGKAVDF